MALPAHSQGSTIATTATARRVTHRQPVLGHGCLGLDAAVGASRLPGCRGVRGRCSSTPTLTVVFALQLRVAAPAGYVALLLGCAILVAAFAAVRLWTGGAWEGRLLALALCLLSLRGYFLHFAIGLPGATGSHSSPGVLGVLGVVAELTILALLAPDAFARPANTVPPRLYAL